MSQGARGACGRVRAGIVGLLVTLSLVACTAQEGDPTPGASGTASSGLTPAATVTPPPTPSEAPEPETPEPAVTFTPPPRPVAPATLDDPTPEGALSAIRYFYDLYPYAYATGDIEGLKDVSGNACGYCMKLMDRIEKFKGDGGTASGFTVKFADAKYDAATATPFHFDFQVSFEVDPGVVRRSQDEDMENLPAEKFDLLISVDLEDRWEFGKVLEVENVK